LAAATVCEWSHAHDRGRPRRDRHPPAREILAARLEQKPAPAPKRERAPKAETPTEQIADFLNSRQGKALQREVACGVFGLLRKKL
jgi:hypothetical protein